MEGWMSFDRRSRFALILLVLVVLALAAPLSFAGATPNHGMYIIVFNSSVTDARGTAMALEKAHGLQGSFIYEHALKGFAATIPAGRLNALKNDPRVAYVEADQEFTIQAQTNPTGIGRSF